jgi:hypothetical protein
MHFPLMWHLARQISGRSVGFQGDVGDEEFETASVTDNSNP